MIELRVLGSPEMDGPDGRDVQSVLRRPKRLALLAYLAAARPRSFHRRDGLLAMFWPDLDQAHARNALRQAVHSLRDALGRDAIVSRGEEELAIDPLRIWCDVAQFERDLETGNLDAGLSLYRGELLSSFHVSGAPGFERWLDQERDHVRRQAVAAAVALAHREEGLGNAIGAARWAGRATEISPYDEDALRRFLRILDRSGNRADAVHQYEVFARRIATDLDLTPGPETTALADAIRNGDAHGSAAPAPPSQPRCAVSRAGRCAR